MKKVNFIILILIVFASAGCKKYLDVNKNPNGPTSADPALYLPSIESQYAQGIQLDARASALFTQNWALYTNNRNFNFVTASLFADYDQHGYIKLSDNGADFWRSVYWRGGINIQDVKKNSIAQQKWDIYGTALALEAWGWQMLTDYHGEIILKEAYDSSKNTFNYDTQDTVYAVVKRECMDALTQMNKTTDGVGSPLFLKYDMIYKGNMDKWKKFVYGLLAINAHHLIKKANYNAQEVIDYVDKSFIGNADDALVPYAGTNSGDASVFGPIRSNQYGDASSAFIVRLTDGTIFGGIKDPRQVIMLAPSTDSVYRGLPPFTGQTNQTATTSVKNLWGTTLGSTNTSATGRYLFQNNAPFPLMTYAMLQFIKAEAALKKGDGIMARDAYVKGINASLDFVRSGTSAPGATPSGGAYVFSQDVATNATFDARKAVFLASPLIIPPAGVAPTIQMIMLQKYIALWSYGFIETWTDLRKFDYDPAIFTSFTLPTPLYPDNANKVIYRVRPRYNSEYIWNINALTKIGGFDPDYQTKKMWIQQ